MSDLESYLVHCYDLLLQEEDAKIGEEAELCACANLIKSQEQENS